MTTRKSFSRLAGGDQPAHASAAEPFVTDVYDEGDASRPFHGGRPNGDQVAAGQSDLPADVPPKHHSENLMTERCLAVTGLDLTSSNDIQRLRELLAPEYATLQAQRTELLEKARGKYVLIHESEVQVHTTLDAAMKSGITDHSEDLFFVGRIDERDLNEYLAA